MGNVRRTAAGNSSDAAHGSGRAKLRLSRGFPGCLA